MLRRTFIAACPATREAPPPKPVEAATAPDAAPVSNPPPAVASVDAGPLLATADVPKAPKLRVRSLPVEKERACTTSALLARLKSCRPIATTNHQGTSGADPNGAFDADACRVWNAGAFPPQAVRATIASDTSITGILLSPEMTPNGQVVHVIELDNATFIVEATFASGQSHFVLFDQPVHAKTLTVRTTRSPSWVAWQKIVPFTCDGPVALDDATEVSPETPRPNPKPKADFIEVRVPGRGECAKDADCVPASCCHPRTCVARAMAPACAGIGCAQNVVEGTIGQGARCACIEKKCGALRREAPYQGGLL